MDVAEITARLALAGVKLGAGKYEDIARAWAMLVPMLTLVRVPAIPPEAEPALIFRAGA